MNIELHYKTTGILDPNNKLIITFFLSADAVKLERTSKDLKNSKGSFKRAMSLTTVLHSEDNRKGKDPDGGSKSKSKTKVSSAKSSDKRRNSIPPDSNKKTEKRKVGVTAASLVKSKSKPTKKVDAKKLVAPSEEIGLVLPNKVEKKSSITEIVQDEVLQKLKQSHKRRRKSLETDSMRNISYKIQTL